jgi:hypothetical protein
LLHKGYDLKGSVEKKEKKPLVVNLKRLGAKANWLAVNRQSYNNSDSDTSRKLTAEVDGWQLKVSTVREPAAEESTS